MKYRRMATLKTADAFRDYLAELGLDLAFDETVETGSNAPLAQSYPLKNGFAVGNRFAVLPMEGWDGTADGRPSELTTRRWERFGRSGAKLIWGGEATAVRHDGRANPNQLIINPDTVGDLDNLRQVLVNSHQANFGNTDDLLVGLQLTHSGRFCRPNPGGKLEPKVAYHHPFLDKKFEVTPDMPVFSDDEVRQLIDDFIRAAKLAQQAGFSFVDIKHCHGYLGHEFLTAIDREGAFGGSFENRTRFLREIVAGIRAEVPGLDIGVRLSAIDFIPFKPGLDDIGQPESLNGQTYPYAFGSDETGLSIELSETFAFLDLLLSLDIELICITAGSPYYTPHLIRPATFPPSDGYLPPEDPLVGVDRHISVTAALKKYRPELTFVGSGYSYLQEWVPNVAQRAIRTGQTDFVGLGRMILTYPEMIADTLAGKKFERKRICRTFSDCTTAPRNGMVSGCYPLDEFYKERPEAQVVTQIKLNK